MKKILALVLVLVVVTGCNKEKTYKDNLNGTWEVYKYLLRNTDKTTQFKNEHPGYSISFTTDNKFRELLTNPDSTYINGTYSFTDNDEKILLENTYNTFVIDTAGDSIFTANLVKREYTIFNLTKDHVQLRNDTSQLYLDKVDEQ